VRALDSNSRAVRVGTALYKGQAMAVVEVEGIGVLRNEVADLS
jgi:hypothetical protein